MDPGDGRVRHLVAAQCEAEVVGSSHEHVFNLGGSLVINAVQAEVQVFELGTSEQVPVRSLISVGVADDLVLNSVENGNRLLRLFLLLQLLVLLDDCIALFELCLIGFDLIRGQGHSSETIEQRQDVLCRQLVLSQTKELKRTVLLKDA